MINNEEIGKLKEYVKNGKGAKEKGERGINGERDMGKETRRDTG